MKIKLTKIILYLLLLTNPCSLAKIYIGGGMAIPVLLPNFNSSSLYATYVNFNSQSNINLNFKAGIEYTYFAVEGEYTNYHSSDMITVSKNNQTWDLAGNLWMFNAVLRANKLTGLLPYMFIGAGQHFHSLEKDSSEAWQIGFGFNPISLSFFDLDLAFKLKFLGSAESSTNQKTVAEASTGIIIRF